MCVVAFVLAVVVVVVVVVVADGARGGRGDIDDRFLVFSWVFFVFGGCCLFLLFFFFWGGCLVFIPSVIFQTIAIAPANYSANETSRYCNF